MRELRTLRTAGKRHLLPYDMPAGHRETRGLPIGVAMVELDCLARKRAVLQLLGEKHPRRLCVVHLDPRINRLAASNVVEAVCTAFDGLRNQRGSRARRQGDDTERVYRTSAGGRLEQRGPCTLRVKRHRAEGQVPGRLDGDRIVDALKFLGNVHNLRVVRDDLGLAAYLLFIPLRAAARERNSPKCRRGCSRTLE